MIGIFTLAMLALGGFMFYNYITMLNRTDVHEDQKTGFLVFAIIIWVIMLIFLCMVYCSWQRIQLAAMIIQATADYITDVKRVLFVPLILFFALAGFLVWWMYSGAYLFSSGNVVHDITQPFGTIKRTEFVNNLQVFNVIYLLWSVFFIDHLGNFVLCAVACIWYFAGNRNKLNSPITTAFSWGLFYHFGTIAFGSFVLAIIWLIKVIIDYMKQAASQERRNSGQGDLVISCLACCAECFDSIIKYLSKHAYIETALHNTNFCNGCYESAALIMNNIGRIGVLHGIANLAIIFGAITISAIATLIGYILMKSYSVYSDVVFETLYPLLVCLLFFYSTPLMFLDNFLDLLVCV